jgi:hypothetical protein
MKKFLLKPYVLDVIKVAIIFATLKLLNKHYMPGNNTGLTLFLLVVVLVKFIFRKSVVESLSKD